MIVLRTTDQRVVMDFRVACGWRQMPLAISALMACLLVPAAALACVELSGEAGPGALLWGRTDPGSQVWLDDEPLRLSPEGSFVLGFGRDAEGESVLRIEGVASCWKPLRIGRREYPVQRIDGLPQQTVTPSPQHHQRIRREQALIDRARSTSVNRAWFSQGFQWPALGPVSGVYGSQRIYNGIPGTPHYGVDVASPEGTAVSAPAAGIVVLAEADLFFSGGTVIIDHGLEVFSSFLHLSKLHARVGEIVQAGELIGEIGASGRATGAHLDWRMKWRKRWIDPQLLVPPMPGSAYNGKP